nr:hypothetical protein [uncultured Kingella sp.]
MSDIKESLRNFSSVYASKGRREFDVGFLIFREDLLDGEKTQIKNFFSAIQSSCNCISIGNPFNLSFSKSMDEAKNTHGWLDNNEGEYLYFLEQDDQPIFVNNDTGMVFAMTFGSNEKFEIADSLLDFISALSYTLLLSVKYIDKNSINGKCNENYYINEDKEYLIEVEEFLKNTELNINMENFYSFLFVGAL